MDHPLAACGPPHPRAAGLSHCGPLLLFELWRRAPLPAAVAWSLALVLPGLWLRAYASGYVEKNQRADRDRPLRAHPQPALSGIDAHRLRLCAGAAQLAGCAGAGDRILRDLRSGHRLGGALSCAPHFRAFEAYCRRVPRLIPRLTPADQSGAKRPSAGAFSFALYSSTASTMLL
jgi:hypothetical protein